VTQSTTSVPRLNHHTNESASFGEIARRRRLDVRVPLRRVADELGFTPAYISDVERGVRRPPAAEVVMRWARLLGADPHEWCELAAVEDGGRYAAVIRAAYRLRDVWESGGFEYVDLADAVQAVVDALREAEGEVEI